MTIYHKGFIAAAGFAIPMAVIGGWLIGRDNASVAGNLLIIAALLLDIVTFHRLTTHTRPVTEGPTP